MACLLQSVEMSGGIPRQNAFVPVDFTFTRLTDVFVHRDQRQIVGIDPHGFISNLIAFIISIVCGTGAPVRWIALFALLASQEVDLNLRDAAQQRDREPFFLIIILK